ncbi:hypothetical protein H2C83_14785 [Thermoactinomyces sp. AMNI-1]|uniref:Uncharacterized protein n=1 Tax=Thermoactinomyces mirandus TaxID=2756294 RepID=A0A7W1XV42_9BACL|nr:hypothetical protein [Thermoactinomyces mirandus]
MSKLTDYCQFEHAWAVFEITGLDNQIERILSVLEIPFSREEVEKKFEEAWEEAERKFVEESEDEFVDFVISHPEDKNIFYCIILMSGFTTMIMSSSEARKRRKKRFKKCLSKNGCRLPEVDNIRKDLILMNTFVI